MKKNYQSKHSIPINQNLQDKLNKVGYNKTLEKAIASGMFRYEFFDYYIQINYVEIENFIKEINIFLEKQYTPDEINSIYTNFNRNNIEKLLNTDYLNLSEFFGIPNFDVDNYERYINWNLDDNLDLATIVTFVNIGLDRDFYTFYTEVQDLTSYTILVNKFNRLPKDFEPDDLVSLSFNPEYKLRRTAAQHFEALVNIAKLSGHHIAPYSAYRSYERQAYLYHNYVLHDGPDIADIYSARPGFSEHQTGLAVDITTAQNVNELTTRDFNWIKRHAHRFGFIIRYPENKKHITGYMHEPWHLRFVGIDVATDFITKNLTFDEYWDLYLK